MEVTRSVIIAAMLVSLQIASANGDVIVQPGYEKKSSNSAKSESPVAKQATELKLADEIKRYHELQQKLQCQILQLMNQGQIQQVQKMPQGVVGYPSPETARTLSRPYYSSAHLHSLTPFGIHRHTIGNYGVRILPNRWRESDSSWDEINVVPTDKSRTAEDESRLNVGLEQVHDVATEPPIEENKINEIIKLPVPKTNVVDDPNTGKVAEIQQIIHRDDNVVSSPLDVINYNKYDNQDQHHPINSEGMASRIINTAQSIADTKRPVMTDFRSDGNKNSIPLMSLRQDPDDSINMIKSIGAGAKWNTDKTNFNDEEIRGKSWNEEQRQNTKWTSTSSAKTLQSPKDVSYDRQLQQNPAMKNAIKGNIWMVAPRTLHGTYQHQTYHSDYHSGYQPIYQSGHQPLYQPGYQPNYQPGYQPNYQPGYQPNYQPIYQNNYERPSIGTNQPLHGNGGSTSTSYASSGPSGSTASASSTSKQNNYKSSYVNSPYVNSPYVNNPYVNNPYVNNPYVNSPYVNSPYVNSPYVNSPYVNRPYANSPYGNSPYVNSPYVSSPYRTLTPYNTAKFVDQFGRTIVTAVPSNFNTVVSGTNLTNFPRTQLASIYQQPRYWY